MITEGHLGRHYQGRKGGRGPALIDIAQDHALAIISEAGIFDLGVVFKGGTALRKYRAGSSGRFSTDLDFSDADQPVAELLLETLDGARLGGFAFRIEPINEHRRSTLHIETPFDVPELPSRIDCSPKKSWLKPQLLSPIELPIHAHYDITIPQIPVMRIEEVLSEKLARYRRASLARDLYDLAWFARGGPMNELLIRKLTVMKIWFDVVDDGLGDRPFQPEDILRQRSEDEFREEDIGYLTTPVDIEGWELATRRRFAFLTDLDATELSVSRCSTGDRWMVEQLVGDLD
jgi:predicted nucleotidyltransferase component of viral defense system